MNFGIPKIWKFGIYMDSKIHPQRQISENTILKIHFKITVLNVHFRNKVPKIIHK